MAENLITLKDVPTVRILILGDKGVGKTSVTNLMAYSIDTPTVASRSVSQHNWDIQVRLHEYSKALELLPMPTWTSFSSSECSFESKTPHPTSNMLYFVEFLDMNSECDLQRVQFRHLFKTIDGIVLVYNLKDLRSQDNLHDWLYEPLRQICKHRHGRRRPILKTHHVPILVAGTRLDQLSSLPLPRSGIAHQLNAEEILLNSQDPESFGDKSRCQEKMHGFLNRVIEFKERYPLWRKRVY